MDICLYKIEFCRKGMLLLQIKFKLLDISSRE